MKTPLIIIAILTTLSLPARTQILGIFEQGAEELSEYGQQIAALELLLTRQQNGYQIIESGLTAFSSITGDEFTLHRNYYGSLGAVNTVIAQGSEIDECMSLESAVLTTLLPTLQRWRTSKYLRAGELAYINQMTEILTNTASAQITSLSLLLTSGTLMMTDDQRISRITQLYVKFRSVYACSQIFINAVDYLILNRMN
jgi:hypothetical protein